MSAFTEFLATTEMGVDLNAVVPCETWNTACDRPAAWLGVQPCCNNRATLCGPCRADRIRQVEQALATRGGFQCGVCNAVPAPVPVWRPL